MNTQLFLGDCLENLKAIEGNECDALITDPPAGISFMSKEWDDDKGGKAQWIAWLTEVIKQVRAIKGQKTHILQSSLQN